MAKVRQIDPLGVKDPTDLAERFLVFKFSLACAALDIPWAVDEHNPRGLMERLKAEAAPEMLEKIEKELGLSYRPDGTPFQDPDNFASCENRLWNEACAENPRRCKGYRKAAEKWRKRGAF